MRDFETGIFYVNSSTIGAEVHLPFGGMKDTGNGHREAGIAGLDVFTEWKSIYVDFSGKLQRAQIDTHSTETCGRGTEGSTPLKPRRESGLEATFTSVLDVSPQPVSDRIPPLKRYLSSRRLS